jgi:hypothetical protein
MFSPVLMILTLIPAMQNWRIGPTHLYAILVKHNIFYYSCGFCELILARAVFLCSFMIISISWSVLCNKHIRIDAPPCAYISRIPFAIELLMFRVPSIPTMPCCMSTHPYILLCIHTNNKPMYSFQFMILAILATRMHLHLWEVNRYAHGSGALVGIPMSDISYLSFTAWWLILWLVRVFRGVRRG